MHFAARDDMFLRGFFAGFPPEMSPRGRRLLFPVSVGRFLPYVAVHPISSASTARLVELLAASPDAPLEDVAPDRLLTLLGERDLPRTARAGRSCAATYADISGSRSRAAKGPTPSGARARHGQPRISASSSASCARESRSSSSPKGGPRRTGRSVRSARARRTRPPGEAGADTAGHSGLRPPRPRAHRGRAGLRGHVRASRRRARGGRPRPARRTAWR